MKKPLRTRVILFRVTEEEYARVAAAADKQAHARTFSDFARATLLTHVDGSPDVAERLARIESILEKWARP